MTIHSQEDLHLGNHLLRYLPFSNARQCVGSVCVLVSEKLCPWFLLPGPPPSPTCQAQKGMWWHITCPISFPAFLFPLGEWVVWTHPHFFKGHRHWPKPWGPALAFPHGLWKYFYFKNIVLFICVGLPYECIYSQYSWNLGKNTFTQRSTFTTIQEAFPPWWDLPPWLNSGGRRTYWSENLHVKDLNTTPASLEQHWYDLVRSKLAAAKKCFAINLIVCPYNSDKKKEIKTKKQAIRNNASSNWLRLLVSLLSSRLVLWWKQPLSASSDLTGKIVTLHNITHCL